MARRQNTSQTSKELEPVAGNGLLHRRLFLAGALGATGLAAGEALAEPLSVPVWTTTPGGRSTVYGEPSRFEAVTRGPLPEKNPLYTAGIQGLRTPLQALEGMMTPSGLHYEVSHNGVPDIDPAQHYLVIHGLVKRPLKFSLERLSRYPMTSRIMFLECAGNSGALYQQKPVPGTAQSLHGLVSCSEWTGVPLSLLLDEAGVDPKAQWIVAEGADAGALTRSVPMVKVMKDAMVALYQNGERIRPTNGYPLRLLVPGFQGNMNIKWLRRIEVTAVPGQTHYETSRYSLLLADGKVAQFKFQLDAKSVITRPSPGYLMQGPGLYEVTGVAWSGNGAIKKVEVSADGGKSWAEAALSGPMLPVALTRFRSPWKWDGGPAILQARATDTTGYVQPTRDALVAARGTKANYHNNAITSWNVAQGGELTHVYA